MIRLDFLENFTPKKWGWLNFHNVFTVKNPKLRIVSNRVISSLNTSLRRLSSYLTIDFIEDITASLHFHSDFVIGLRIQFHSRLRSIRRFRFRSWLRFFRCTGDLNIFPTLTQTSLSFSFYMWGEARCCETSEGPSARDVKVGSLKLNAPYNVAYEIRSRDECPRCEDTIRFALIIYMSRSPSRKRRLTVHSVVSYVSSRGNFIHTAFMFTLIIYIQQAAAAKSCSTVRMILDRSFPPESFPARHFYSQLSYLAKYWLRSHCCTISITVYASHKTFSSRSRETQKNDETPFRKSFVRVPRVRNYGATYWTSVIFRPSNSKAREYLNS